MPRKALTAICATVTLAATLGAGPRTARADVTGAAAAAARGYRPSPATAAGAPTVELAYSDFLGQVDRGAVREVTVADQSVTGTLTNGSGFRTTPPRDAGLIPRLLDHHVRITAVGPDDSRAWYEWLILWFTLLLLVGMTGYAMWSSPRQTRTGSRVRGFGQSPAKEAPQGPKRVTFEDVAGIEEAELELREIVDFLRGPEKFRRLGASIPKGCLLSGPPGTGKTLLARAMAGEAGVPFFSISGSAFVEMYVGVGAARVRDLFEKAKTNAPCIVFIDEIDAVGRHRGSGLGGNDERDQTLNQLLVEMDGFEANQGVIVVAATNRPDILDPALLRPGRFDRQVTVPAPDVAGREKILRVHLHGVPLASEVDPNLIARATPGFSGAELANLVNEAALLAARRNVERVGSAELDEARDKVLMGAERRSLAMTAEEKRTTAIHEAGHALVAIHTPGCDPVHKVTIVPRGRALGVTLSLPERDRYGLARLELEAKIAMMFGGRVAEELTFGRERITTGASDDIRQATALARRMVTEFGFSDRLGPLRYGEGDQEGFLGHGGSGRANVSEVTARIIDEETRRVVEDGEASARKVLTEHADQLRRLAEALLDRETLSGEDIRALLGPGATDLAAGCGSELARAATGS